MGHVPPQESVTRVLVDGQEVYPWSDDPDDARKGPPSMNYWVRISPVIVRRLKQRFPDKKTRKWLGTRSAFVEKAIENALDELESKK